MRFILRIVAYGLTALPYRFQLALGRALGLISYALMSKRRKIAFKNIEHCFPELSPAEQHRLCLANFKGNGMGLMEALASWFMSERRIRKIPFTWIGKEHYEAALKTGKGVIALSAHFTCVEMIGRIYCKYIPSYGVYKASRNQTIDQFILEGRHRYAKGLLKHSNMKAMISTLRKGRLLWFAPDQDFGRVQAEFVPFCGVPAATIPATSILAKLGHAVVMPMFFHRTPTGYALVTMPVWENFPSGDHYQDSKRYNDLLTDFVKQHPVDYFWVHRRFKTTASGQNFYQ